MTAEHSSAPNTTENATRANSAGITPSGGFVGQNGEASVAGDTGNQEMRYFALPNLSSQQVSRAHPLSFKPKIPFHSNKQERRAWQSNPTTQHFFYSCVEGRVPSLRVTESNPPRRLWGLVVDYDIKVTDELSLIERAAPGLLPTWISRTFSGGRRLVFEFETPVLVDHAEIAKRFLKVFADDARLESLLPGLDKASFTLTQYFELGHDWQRIPGSKPLSRNLLGLFFYRAATQKTVRGDGPEIPVEDIADEVERRWPGRWPGNFEEGVRGPLFWIDDGNDREGCQVGKYGMICYSTRAGKSFLHWGEILGKEFVRNYAAERIGAATSDIWFDSKSYWARLANGEWAPNTKDDIAADLQVKFRLSTKNGKNEVMEALSVIRNTHRITGTFPFIHNRNQIIEEKAGTFLNTSTRKLILPASSDGESPWLDQLFDNWWDAKHPEQKDYLLSWFHYLYKSAYEGNLKAGQALIIIGETNRGKTLLSRKIVGAALGGFADAGDFMLGKTAFNKECAETAVWAIDDNRGGATWEKHDEFSNALKRYVANPDIPYHPKYKDAATIPWRGRIIVTANTDAKSLSILPDLDDSILDKLMLFKLGEWEPDFSMPEGVEARIERELPFFLRRLLAFEVPAHIQGDPRFGVKCFHHPELVREANNASANGQLVQLMAAGLRLTVWTELKEASRWMSAVDIRRMLDIDGLRGSLQKYAGNRLGIALSSVGRPLVLGHRWLHGTKQYLINLDFRLDEPPARK